MLICNGSISGPIIKDRLWWFTSARHISVNEKVTNAFYPDGSPAIVDQYVRDILNRMTAQVTPRNKVSVYFERIWKFKGHELNPGYDVVTATISGDKAKIGYSSPVIAHNRAYVGISARIPDDIPGTGPAYITGSDAVTAPA